MTNRHFNLIQEPWIQVITSADASVKTVSLTELFTHAKEYRRLAGDMRIQDLAILRFLLAILHTVYSRFDANNDSYPWLTLDPKTRQVVEVDQDDFDDADMLVTWQAIYRQGRFSDAVLTYLNQFTNRFDFFGEQPFYQVTEKQYNDFVPPKKQIVANKNHVGTVDIKQINRQISESGHTLAVFTPRTNAYKNKLSLAELTRWIITYQNFTGIAEKTKITADEHFTTKGGWLYQISPVFAQGQTVFDTLMLNLDLVPNFPDELYHVQRPVWEYRSVTEYVDFVKSKVSPDNLAALYTTWSRLLHIQWADDEHPTIFSAILPMFDSNTFIEPMTTWRYNKKAQQPTFLPTRKNEYDLSKAMWRSFGLFINPYRQDSVHQPGIVTWLNRLREHQLIDRTMPLTLTGISLVYFDSKSQVPVFESIDDMTVETAVLFDHSKANNWPQRIADTITQTQQVGNDYESFMRTINDIRGNNSKAFASNESKKFYARLNRPFKAWLATLTIEDDRSIKITEWYSTLKQIALAVAKEFCQSATPRDIKGIIKTNPTTNVKTLVNIFTAYNRFASKISRDLDVRRPKEATNRAN